MSKKKFKKKKHKKHSKQNVYVAPRPTASAAPAISSDVTEEEAPEIIEEEIAKPTQDAVIPAEEEKEYAYVRKDVRQILIVMGSIIALLIIAFIVNSKTTIFYSMGDWLYNALNIQTQ
jgi:hypothetical protein